MSRVASSGSTNNSDGGSGGSRGGGSVGGRSALISDLVAQLKRGDITKKELFSRLQQLQGPASAAADPLVGAATSISTPASVSTTGSANTPPASASAVVGLETAEASPPATAIPGESPAAAGESAVFFSAHDRQVIIQKIADERRRRALDVIRATPPNEEGPIGTRRRSSSSRTNAQAPSQPLTSPELSTPVAHSDPIAVDSYAASQPPQQPQHQQQGQSFSRKDSHPPPPSTAGDTHSSNRDERDGDGLVGAVVVEEDLGRRTAWEEGQERQEAATGAYDTLSNKFPFPGTHDQSNSRSRGGADRQDQLVVDTNEDSGGETFGAPSSSSRGVAGGGGTPGKGAEPMMISQPSSRNSTDRIDATARGNRRLSRGGSGSSNGRSHDRNSLIASRRRSSGGSGGSGVSAGDGPSSPGWSSYARRLSGHSGGGAFGGGGAGGSGYGTEGNTRGGGGSERYGGHRREYQTVSGRAAKGQEGSSPSRFRHDDVTDHQQNSSHRVEQARVGERRESHSGSWTHGGAGVREGDPQGRDRGGRGAGDRNRQTESRAVGRGRWTEGSASLEEEGASTEMAGQQRLQQQQPQEQPQREEWDEARGGGLGGGGGGRQHQASERTVDEDAYRFRSFSEERARRGEELVRRELMSECTFRPKIKGLPQSYGTTNHDDTPFLQRVHQWQKDKEKDADTRKAHGQDKELEECTFTPRVNGVSRRAARSRRQALGENHLTVDDRLYDEFVRREMDRSHLAAEKAAREEEQLHEECTFRPDLPTKRAADAIAAVAAAGAAAGGREENSVDWGYTVPRGRSRYRQAAAAVAAAVATGGVGAGGSVWGAGRRANGGRENGRKVGGRGGGRRHWELEPCTFTPNVIGARKGMDQAQQYLQYDVVERLTGAAFRSSDGSDCNDSEGSEEGEALLRERGGTLRNGLRQGFGVGREGISTSNWDSGDGEKQLAYGTERQEAQSPRQRKGGGGSDTSSSFHAFLSRQNKLETDKLKHIEQIQARYTMRQHTFQPEICAESTKIHKESNKGDFLQRVARDAARKEHEAVRQKAAGLHDPDCTFKPQITARSATLQARSVVELSRGDQLKRETTQRLSRLRAEQELLADTTFRPRINADAASQMAVSKLKVVSDPDNYIATVETLRRRKEESVVKGAIERAAKEVEGCTFKPETTECPAYITRIAQSICASKALPRPGGGKKQVKNAKPDWR
ncbi:unnamed protein product [Ectocarpus sp. 12 AP-2014]